MTAARFPRKVWIGTHEVRVQFVPGDHKELDPTEPDGARLRGVSLCDDPPSIFIDEALNASQMLEVVLHELTHLINWAHDLEDPEEGEKHFTEEDVADVHGKAWAMFLIANPRFQTWLTRTCNAIRKEQKDG